MAVKIDPKKASDKRAGQIARRASKKFLAKKRKELAALKRKQLSTEDSAKIRDRLLQEIETGMERGRGTK